MNTPLIVEICLHYATCGNDFAPDRFDAPAVKEAIEMLVEEGILIDNIQNAENSLTKPLPKPRYSGNPEALRPYLSAICSIPLPRMMWVVDKLDDAERPAFLRKIMD